ncbi:hypothetical protein K7640_01100 [Micromonospora sp. PLK6-60]|uniref:hypothetical protein n=1 Tax=Micromonospora sp. PLK6-60 TaxID=2873383 RepID=UPI001CA63C73|nr:hypothetical protein [Micromonospora sp. PLK6-60]MBY8870437.1 hypothetical protein [Micromonospora sp. PLK6-60]
MTPPRRYRVGRMLDASAVRAAADAHPRLRGFMRTLAEHSERGEPRSRALLEFMIRRVVDDVGDLHIGNATARLERIQVLRDNIAAILDHVLDGGDLPEGVRMETLGEYFEQLNTEMRELSGPREAIVGDGPLPLYDDAASYARSLLREFEGMPDGGAGGRHVEPAAELAAAFRRLPPEQAAALRRASELDPRRVWQRVSAESEATARQATAQLETALAGRMTAEELARLRGALDELGRARNTAAQMNATRLAEALARIDDADLRAVVANGDVWLIQQVAAHNPAALTELWRNFRRGGGAADDAGAFRAYVRHEMTHYGRAAVGEYTAAFSLSSVEAFLRGPDAQVRERGIDLIGIGHDGWLWLIDDKSHRASGVSSVTSLTDNLATNLRTDAATFRGVLDDLRARDPAFVPDPRVLDAIQRMADAAAEIDRINRTGPAAGRPARIAQALEDRRLRLRVTSAAGQVTELTKALRDLGMAVEPTGTAVPWPNPGGR